MCSGDYPAFVFDEVVEQEKFFVGDFNVFIVLVNALTLQVNFDCRGFVFGFTKLVDRTRVAQCRANYVDASATCALGANATAA